MAKKDKRIEISMTETKKELKGTTYEAYELALGKKNIGTILKINEKSYEVFYGEEDLGAHKNLDLATEALVRQYNLHNN